MLHPFFSFNFLVLLLPITRQSVFAPSPRRSGSPSPPSAGVLPPAPRPLSPSTLRAPPPPPLYARHDRRLRPRPPLPTHLTHPHNLPLTGTVSCPSGGLGNLPPPTWVVGGRGGSTATCGPDDTTRVSGPGAWSCPLPPSHLRTTPRAPRLRKAEGATERQWCGAKDGGACAGRATHTRTHAHTPLYVLAHT